MKNPAAIGAGNRVDAVSAERAYRAGNSNLCHLVVNAVSEFAVFTSADQANAAYFPHHHYPQSHGIAWH